MIRRFSINFALFSMGVDILSVVVALFAASRFRPALNPFGFVQPITNPVELPRVLFFLFPAIWWGIFTAFAIYDGRKYLKVVDEFAALTLASFIAAISAAGILYLSFREVSRALFFLFVVFTTLLFLVWRVAVRISFRMAKDRTEPSRRILIVGVGSLGDRVRDQILTHLTEDPVVVGFLDDAPSEAKNAGPILGGKQDMGDVIAKYLVTDVVIALPHSAYRQMADYVQSLDTIPVKVWIALGFFDLALYNMGIEDFAGIPMLDLRAPVLSDYQRLIKRAYDLILGLLGLLLASPVMLVAALSIRLLDGSPVLFRQKRVGENGRLFDMLKFRTMVRQAEDLRATVEQQDKDGNIIHKSKNDPRVTPLGRFLRRFSLDELPQFLNVIKGDMSLVGPRPELPYLVEKYQPWQRKRFSVPQGMTGWWQITGRSEKPMHLSTEEDLYYVRNYSISLDIQIIVRTIWVVLIGRGSY